jgi:hypothetical protein
MKTIRGAVREIAWVGRWEYLLRSGPEVIGKLHIKNDPGMSAVAESTDGSWRFKKNGFPMKKSRCTQRNPNLKLGCSRIDE